MTAELGDAMADHTDQCLFKEIAECKVLVGEELSKNELWISTTIEYAIQLVTTATIFKIIPPCTLPLVYRLVPAYRRLQRSRRTASSLIKPIIQSRRAVMDDSGINRGGDNLLQWMLNERVKKRMYDKDFQMMADLQLELAFASTHTTTMTLTNIMFDLIAWPKYIDILREEVEEVLQNNGGSFRGNFTKTLLKMDSFMKESQRRNPVGYGEFLLDDCHTRLCADAFTVSMARDLCQDTILSDGTFLPKGTFVVANSYHITHDQEILESDTDPNTFDGLRYYKMRNKLVDRGLTEKEAAGKYQFVSASDSSLAFGGGRRACPGRYFAGAEIKILLAKLLLQFDFRMPDGATEQYQGDSFEQAVYQPVDRRDSVVNANFMA
ncbi:hypothetical protein M409DRAFT_52455 [Zasmidium cellare ATCC 36951]|uniref:Cytochrome P450 n=1 Tax=Zasmidium cellare ATCC 36951 TaxID=1080233 RepID=A0A6A6CPV6_ZASCE|nr:uncharacterized protein M409DRAFT_52455 [Zasmidium cellare ATCC 36951]KAF2169174.1 hypothetical protein M409DRAFT_52455 [Zasmidium cellare ATCC 36951]